MQQFVNKLIPFLVAGIAVVAFAFGIVILAYLFLFFAFVGLILFAVSWLRYRFSARKQAVNRQNRQKKTGRIIDVNDWKEL